MITTLTILALYVNFFYHLYYSHFKQTHIHISFIFALQKIIYEDSV